MNYEIFARSYSEGETIRYHRMNETRGTPDERRWYMAPIVFVGKLAVPPEEWDDDPKTYEEIDPILETEKLNYEIDDTKAKNESKIRLANLPKPKSSNDPVFSYTDEQRRSIEEIVGMEEWYRRSFIRVIVGKPNPISGKVSKTINPHWKSIPKTSVEIGLSKWAYMTEMSKEDFDDHLSKSNAVFGIIPFMLGLAVIDIDHEDPDYLMIVIDRIGQPLSSYSTPSGGFHAIYPIRDLEVAKSIPASSFSIAGERIGEVCCLHRFANAWEPSSWSKAAGIRRSIGEDWSIWFDPSMVDFQEQSRAINPKKPRTSPRETSPFDVTADEIVDHYEMTPTVAGEYQGHCPICDPHKLGGGTRFKLRPQTDDKFLLNCFACAEDGFSDRDFLRIIEPICRKKKIKVSPSLMGTIVNPSQGEIV